MIITKLIFIVLLLVCIQTGFAQQLVPTVLSSSGGFYNQPEAMLSFTTGESSVITSLVSPSAILTQGFQQSWDFGTYVEEHPESNFIAAVFPNPSDGHVDLFTKSEINAEMHVKVSDLLGREILQRTYYREGLIHDQPLDLTGMAQGIYVVILSWNALGILSPTPAIEKIQIVK